MLVNLYRLKSPAAVFSLPVLSALLYIILFFRVDTVLAVPFDWQADFFQSVQSIPLLHFVIMVLITSFNAHQINNLVNQQSFYQKDTFLPGLIYLIGLLSFGGIDFGPYLLAHSFLIIGLMQLFQLRRQDASKAIIFNASFFFGLATVFSPSLMVLLFLPWIGLAIFRPFVWREWFLAVPGILIPVVFHFAIHYVTTDSLTIQSTVAGTSADFPDMNLILLSLISWTGILVLISLVGIIGVARAEVVRVKKQIQLVYNLLWITVGSSVLSFFLFSQSDIVLIIPLSILMATHYLHAKNQMIVNIGVVAWFIITVVNLWSGVIH